MALTDSYQRTFDFHDGSHYQPDAGTFDPRSLAAASTPGTVGPIISWKCGQGLKSLDPTFSRYRGVFNQVFHKVVWYWWLVSTSDPAAQARGFLDAVGVWRPNEEASVDAEESLLTEQMVLTFVETIEEVTHVPSTIYTGLYVAGGTIWRSQRLRQSKYGPRKMHLAAYVSRGSLLSRLTSLGVLTLPMHIWQYSSNGDYVSGLPQSLPGVTGRADLNHVCDWAIYSSAVPPSPSLPQPPEEEIVYLSNSASRSVDGQVYDPGHVWVEFLPGGHGRAVSDINQVLAALGGTAEDAVNNTAVRRSNAVLDAILANPVPPPPIPTVPAPTGPTAFPSYSARIASVPGDIVLTPQA